MTTNKNLKINIIKNASIAALVLACYPIQSQALGSIRSEEMNNFLLVIGMLLVTACFANFAFTYEKAKLSRPGSRLLAHISTFIFMLLIALMLESTALAVNAVYPSFSLMIYLYCLMLYAGVVLYDFWDLSTVK